MIIPRMRTVALLTAAAAGGPYVASETEIGRDAMETVAGTIEEGQTYLTSTEGDAGYAINAHHEVEKLRGQDPSRYRYHTNLVSRLGGKPEDTEQAPTLVGQGVADLRDVIRFDITPEWVMSRYSRVSTVLADLRLEGLRVPLVTGTKADDLAGTLTYYFDPARKLQRVTIHGFTGDPARLVATMTEHYGLRNEPNLEAGVFTKRWNAQPVHFLRLSHAPVVYSDAVHQKFTVFLELNQPDLHFGISEEASRIVHSDRASGRW